MVLAYGDDTMNTQTKAFAKSNLKTGMVVRMRGGSYEADKFNGLCLVVADCLIQSYDPEPLDCYNNDLSHRSFNQLDIIEVFEVTSALGKPLEKIEQWGLKSIWKCPEQTRKLKKQIAELNAEKEKLMLQVREIDGKITELESK